MPGPRVSHQQAFGAWLSLVEHLVRDQGVGGSNPLSPTNLSLALSIIYASTVVSVFSVRFGTSVQLRAIRIQNRTFLRWVLRDRSLPRLMQYLHPILACHPQPPRHSFMP